MFVLCLTRQVLCYLVSSDDGEYQFNQTLYELNHGCITNFQSTGEKARTAGSLPALHTLVSPQVSCELKTLHNDSWNTRNAVIMPSRSLSLGLSKRQPLNREGSQGPSSLDLEFCKAQSWDSIRNTKYFLSCGHVVPPPAFHLPFINILTHLTVPRRDSVTSSESSS